MGNMSRNKGQRAEREIIELLQPVVNRVYSEAGLNPPELARNLQQTASGGFDIIGLTWMALEVKRQEQLNLSAWWKQTLEQAKPNQEPILLYRQNRKAWRARMHSHLEVPIDAATNNWIKVVSDISLEDFLFYVDYRLRCLLRLGERK